MQVLVTGAAGFIGSHLVEALVARGDVVRAVDCFTPYYDRAVKEANLAAALGAPGAERIERVDADLRVADLPALLDGVEVVYHLAGQPGVRLSWADGFAEYDSHNILATQRLLEACRATGTRRLVFASSSSVYGNAERYPTLETDTPRPRSPYGVTKLAAEFLCRTYADNWGVPSVVLRYFTVYGPRQRPDMAFHRLLTAGVRGEPFPMYGDGSQVREFTYVGDVVAANLAAGDADVAPAEVFNVSGGSAVSLAEAIGVAEDLLGGPIALDRRDAAPGDAYRTGGSIDKARSLLGWAPVTGLRDGMAAELAWLQR